MTNETNLGRPDSVPFRQMFPHVAAVPRYLLRLQFLWRLLCRAASALQQAGTCVVPCDLMRGIRKL